MQSSCTMPRDYRNGGNLVLSQLYPENRLIPPPPPWLWEATFSWVC